MNVNLLWNNALKIIKDNISDDAFDTWFTPIIPRSLVDDLFTIQVPSQFFYEYLEDKFGDLLMLTLRRVISKQVKLQYSIIVDNHEKLTVDYPGKEGVPSNSTQRNNNGPQSITPFTPSAAQDFDAQLNPNYTFDNYFESYSNKLVRTAGVTISENPGKTAFNPLFIYGPSGVGKTHICHAIGCKIRKLYPEKRVLCVSAHLFKLQYTDAVVKRNNVNDFIKFYQNIDVLIIDDIQELIGLTGTQRSFFHIFNHLQLLGKQIIMTSDKPPVELQGMEERLMTRLKWGLTAEIERPDLELRKLILENKIKENGLKLNEDVFEFIAQNVTDNVRDLEGVLVSLMANSVINNVDIDLPLTKKIIGQSVHIEEKEITIEGINKLVCEQLNLEPELLVSRSRKREVVLARQLAMFLSKKYTSHSLAHIGVMVGKRDHTTVMHACKAIQNQIDSSGEFRERVSKIENILIN